MEETFSISSVDHHIATSTWLAILFCLFWPFVTAALMPKRGRSQAPLAAMAAPLAVSMIAMWLGLFHTLQGLAISGAWPRAAAAAGVAEALSCMAIGGASAVFIALIALLRRHRAFAGRGVVMLYASLLVELTGALLLGASIGTSWSQVTVCIVGAIVAGIVAIVAVAYTWLAARGRISAAPLRFAVPLLAAVCGIAGIVVWQQVERYAAIASGG